MTGVRRATRRIRWLFQAKIRRQEIEEKFALDRYSEAAATYKRVRDDQTTTDNECDRAEAQMKAARHSHIDARARLDYTKALMAEVIGILGGKKA